MRSFFVAFAPLLRFIAGEKAYDRILLRAAGIGGLVHLQPVSLRKRREKCMRLALIPVSHRNNIRILRQVTVITPPAQILNRYTQIFFEADWIKHMPAVHPEALLRVV